MPDNKPKHVQLFGVQVSVNAVIVLSLGLMMSVVMLLLPSGKRAVAALSMLLTTCVVSYNINCSLVGHCAVWAWILTAVFVTDMALVFVYISIARFFSITGASCSSSSSSIGRRIK